jgi:hypothetical protein
VFSVPEGIFGKNWVDFCQHFSFLSSSPVKPIFDIHRTSIRHQLYKQLAAWPLPFHQFLPHLLFTILSYPTFPFPCLPYHHHLSAVSPSNRFLAHFLTSPSSSLLSLPSSHPMYSSPNSLLSTTILILLHYLFMIRITCCYLLSTC